MASLENRTGYYNIIFRFGGKKFTRSLKTDDQMEAERRRANLEQTIRDVNSGRLEMPDNADVPTFLLSDGKLTQPLQNDSEENTGEAEFPGLASLKEVFNAFFDSLPVGAVESNSLATMNTHKRHLLRLLGEGTASETLDLNSLDKYVRQHSQEPGTRNRTVGATTIQKELATLRRVWNWARKRSKVSHDLPALRDVQLPKTQESPPFQTWEEIRTQIDQGQFDEDAQKALWDCLYLDTKQISDLLDHIQVHARHEFIHPMCVMAAHTGARRSELIRSELSDLRDGFVIIREKKKRHSQSTTRRVPMSSRLQEVIENWKANHPGGQFTFCLQQVSRSRKSRDVPQGITREEATHHFQSTLKGAKWQVVKGWHCLRHSCISNLASQGVDQRLIDEFVGHSTDEMRRRYRHLFPDIKATAIRSVFG